MPRPVNAESTLQRQAWIALILFGVAIFAGWATFRNVGAMLGENEAPTARELILTLVLIVGGIVWHARRQPLAEVRSWLQVRMLWQRRDWTGLFGFSCALFLAGLVFGALLSATKWLQLPASHALPFSLVYALVGGLLGFLGGLSIHLPGAGGWTESRSRAST